MSNYEPEENESGEYEVDGAWASVMAGYTDLDIQPWEAMESWMTKDEFIGFLRGNIIKYLARAPHKGGVEDYRKAKHYLEKLLSLLAES